MSQVTISIPDEILLALKATPEILADRIPGNFVRNAENQSKPPDFVAIPAARPY